MSCGQRHGVTYNVMETGAPASERSSMFSDSPADLMTCRYFDSNGKGGEKRFSFWIGKTDRNSDLYDAFKWKSADGIEFLFFGSGSPDSPGWWFGTLNGKRAAGHNILRKHYVFSAENYELSLECWSDGYEHGKF